MSVAHQPFAGRNMVQSACKLCSDLHINMLVQLAAPSRYPQILLDITSKGLMVFFEFWSGSYQMSLEPNSLIFLGLILLFEIYMGM